MSISVSRSPSVSAIGAQPLDAELTAIAGLTSAANKMNVWTGSGTAQIETFQDWTAYTPTWTNTTLGSGALGGQYTQIGKYVCFTAFFTLGAGSAVSGSPIVSLPVQATSYSALGTAGNRVLGTVAIIAAGTSYTGVVCSTSQTTATCFVNKITISAYSGTQQLYVIKTAMGAAIPNTFTSGDEIFCIGSYIANAV